MTRLDDIEDAARFRFERASTDGGKQLYGDILALVAVARAADDVSCDGCDYPDKVCGTARRGKCRSCRLREALAPLLQQVKP